MEGKENHCINLQIFRPYRAEIRHNLSTFNVQCFVLIQTLISCSLCAVTDNFFLKIYIFFLFWMKKEQKVDLNV